MCRRLLSIILLVIALLLALPMSAQDSTKVNSRYPEGHKSLLILNSFAQESPLARSFTTPITMHLAKIPDVHCEMYFLNCAQITDSLEYAKVSENLFNDLEDLHPDYLVMIGKMAFTLRDKIKEKWGDIPILLISTSEYIADYNYYLSGSQNPTDNVSKVPLAKLQKDYNFTAVIVPYFFAETVDLMLDMQPGIKEFVFASDATYVNRNMAQSIRNYLLEEFPGIKFRWLEANESSAEEFQAILSNPDPTRGIMLSTWVYSKPGPFGYPISSSQELNMVSVSANPVYVFTESYLELGATGGVFFNRDEVQGHISNLFGDMLAGKPMRDVEIFNCDSEHVTMLNYPQLRRFGLNPKNAPKGTMFIDEPVSLWDRYHWEMIGFSLLVLIVIFSFWKRNITQHKQIDLLSRHKSFIDKMPISYTKAQIVSNKKGLITNINYTSLNQAFQKIIDENSDSANDYLLFPAEFISKKVRALVDSMQDVRFTYHFDKTDTDYDFVLSLVSTADKTKAIREIDIFAIDATQRTKMEEEMREITKKLDLTMNVAGIIPWWWNVKTDELKIDAYSLFERNSHIDLDSQPSVKKEVVVDSMNEYFPLVHKDDYDRLYNLRVALISNEISNFKCRYRLRLARDGQEYYQWVEIRGNVVRRDIHGNPTEVAGAMWLLDDTDIPESELNAPHK